MSLWDEIWAYLDKYYFSATVGDQYVYLKFDGKTGMTVFAIIVGLCIGMAIASFAMLYQRNHVGRFVRRLFKKNAHTADTAVTLSELSLEKDLFLRHALSSPTSVVRKMVHIVTEEGILIRNLFRSEITPEMGKAEWDRTAAAIEAKKKKEKAEREREYARKLAEKHGEMLPEEVPEAESPANEIAAEEAVAKEEGANGGTTPAEEKELPTSKAGIFGRLRGEKFPKPDFAKDKFYIPEELKFRAGNRYEKEKFGLPLAIGASVLFLVIGFLLVRFLPLLLGLLDGSLQAMLG